MNKPVTTLNILTLGRFSLSMNGKTVTTDWPDEKIKNFFCSLLSPLDIYITWDRICRSMLGLPETRTSRSRLEEDFIRPLNSFLLRELGFTPLIAGLDSIRIDRLRIHLDALEFHSSAVEGLRLLSLGNNSAALEKLNIAKSLHVGTYLPGMSGKIIESTRNDLESVFRTAVMEGVRHANAV